MKNGLADNWNLAPVPAHALAEAIARSCEAGRGSAERGGQSATNLTPEQT
jgi:hypothetical protein